MLADRSHRAILMPRLGILALMVIPSHLRAGDLCELRLVGISRRLRRAELLLCTVSDLSAHVGAKHQQWRTVGRMFPARPVDGCLHMRTAVVTSRHTLQTDASQFAMQPSL